jgi:hypothetical protein
MVINKVSCMYTYTQMHSLLYILLCCVLLFNVICSVIFAFVTSYHPVGFCTLFSICNIALLLSFQLNKSRGFVFNFIIWIYISFVLVINIMNMIIHKQFYSDESYNGIYQVNNELYVETIGPINQEWKLFIMIAYIINLTSIGILWMITTGCVI